MFNQLHRLSILRFGVALVLLAGMLGMLPVGPVLASTITVTTTADSGPGSLRQAVLDVASGDTIRFDPSLAGQTITLLSVVPINYKSVVLDGSGLSPQVTISGGGTTGFVIRSSAMNILDVTISDFDRPLTFDDNAIIRNSNLKNFTGDMVRSTAGALTIINSTLEGSEGRAIVSMDSVTTITGSVLRNNFAGIDMAGTAPLTITNSILQGHEGDAISVQGPLTIENSTLVDNYGRGIVSVNNFLSIVNTTIYQTPEGIPSGEALALEGMAEATIVNSTIITRPRVDRSGILVDALSIVDIYNSTVVGLTNQVFTLNHATLNAYNSILLCVHANECFSSRVGTINNVNSIVGVNDTTGQYGLGAPADHGGPTLTAALLPGSPLIDAGDDAICAAAPVNNLDQRGVTRPWGNHCDIGAYEYDGPPSPTQTVLTTSPNPAELGQTVLVTATVTSAAGTPMGTVVFKDGGATIAGCDARTLSGGQVTCTTSTLTEGTHVITAEYSGHGNFAASTSPQIIQAVYALPQVKAGWLHGCFVRNDGTLACWGWNNVGQATPPSGTFLQISTGSEHNCGIKSDGSLACWGNNGYGQLNVPGGPFVQVSVGLYYSCALRNDGSLACWGWIPFEQVPQPSETFTQVSAGAIHACGLRSDGTLACWGSNTDGQLNNIPSGVFKQVDVGAYHTCGLRNDGTLACWGSNINGQMNNVPTGAFQYIDAGYAHTCGFRSDGSLTCWGNNNAGQLNVPSGTFTQVSTHEWHTCALRSDEAIACWGANAYGQAPAVTVSPETLPNATVGAAYNQTLTASGGTSPYTFSVVAGALPAGLTLASDSGGLSGTPTAAGTFNFTVQATGPSSLPFSGQRPYTLVVDKGTATVTLTNLTQTYNGTDTTVTAITIPPGLSVTFTYNGSSTPPINVGDYTVVATVVDPNYQGDASDTLTIVPVPLTVTADDKTKEHGAVNPAFTASYNGFVMDQDPSVLGGTLIFSTEATQSSPVGTYTITPSGLTSTNYTITFIDGTLNVVDTTAPQVVSIVRVGDEVTSAATVDFTVTFSELVTDVDVTAPSFDDFALTTTGVTGASITGVSGSGSVWSVTVNTGSGNGTLRLDVPASATITDMAMNMLGGLPYTSGQEYAIDKVPGTGLYDDRDDNWTFSAGWTDYNNTGPYNNTSRYTNVVGSQAQFTFNGNKFTFTYVKASNRGLIDVYVDGAKIAQINAKNRTLAWQQTWTSPTLVPGIHTVRFVHAGASGTYIDVDALRVYAPTDLQAPAAITDLDADTGTNTGTVALTWTAPGDDGTTGTATSYLVRYSTAEINSLDAWNAATPVTTGVPIPVGAGTRQNMTVSGLTPEAAYFFGVRAQDEEGNLAGVSNSPSAPAQGIAPVPAGNYDDTDINWIYSGSWSTYNGGGPANNTSHYTSTVGNAAQISIDGVKFKFTYLKASNRGLIDVYVDGTKIAQLNAKSTATTWQTTWTSPDLPPGVHVVRFVHAGGGTYIDIDKIQVIGAPVTVPAGDYDDNHAAWTFSSNWTTYAGAGPLNNTNHYTSVVGSEAQISFTGTGFTFTYVKASNRGLIDVYVDGTKVGQINAKSSTTLWRQTWTSQPLTSGTHTVRFVHAGGGTYIDVDAITILP